LLVSVLTLFSACKLPERVPVEPTQEKVVLDSIVHMSDPRTAVQLVSGFHEIEQNSWRWTMSKFAVVLKPPAGSEKQGARLVAKISVPEPVIQRVKQTRLTASAGRTVLGSQVYSSAGEFTFVVDVPASALGEDTVTFDFSLDRFLIPGAVDTRELGLVVSSIGLELR
jgi:hypothetical protein